MARMKKAVAILSAACVLLAAACVVLAVLLWSEHQTAERYRDEVRHSQQNVLWANGRIAATFGSMTHPSHKTWVETASACEQAKRELDVLERQIVERAKKSKLGAAQQLGGLERFYDSVQRYLTALAEEGTVDLTIKDKTVVGFIQRACERVYAHQTDADGTDTKGTEEFVEKVYTAIGEEFEKTFHTFDRADFFRADDPLEAFFEV